MKNIHFILSLMLALTSWVAFAQQDNRPRRTPEQEAQKQTEVMQRELELSDEQVDSVYAINLKYAILRQQSADRVAVMTRAAQKQNDLKRVLTVEQYQHFVNRQSNYPVRHQSFRVLEGTANIAIDTISRAEADTTQAL